MAGILAGKNREIPEVRSEYRRTGQTGSRRGNSAPAVTSAAIGRKQESCHFLAAERSLRHRQLMGGLLGETTRDPGPPLSPALHCPSVSGPPAARPVCSRRPLYEQRRRRRQNKQEPPQYLRKQLFLPLKSEESAPPIPPPPPPQLPSTTHTHTRAHIKHSDKERTFQDTDTRSETQHSFQQNSSTGRTHAPSLMVARSAGDKGLSSTPKYFLGIKKCIKLTCR